jgi:hypothetical protein
MQRGRLLQPDRVVIAGILTAILWLSRTARWRGSDVR